MDTWVTDASHVALFDPATGIAFGETFGSEEEARDFLRWLKVRGATPKRIYTGWPRLSIGLREQYHREQGPTTAEVAAFRRRGECSVCGETGYRPWQLDDSGRCLKDQP